MRSRASTQEVIINIPIQIQVDLWEGDNKPIVGQIHHPSGDECQKAFEQKALEDAVKHEKAHGMIYGNINGKKIKLLEFVDVIGEQVVPAMIYRRMERRKISS